MAMAYLVKDDVKRCEKLLRESAKLDPTSRFYYGVFGDTVSKNQWIWRTKAVAEEFMLYCMADSTRNADWGRK